MLPQRSRKQTITMITLESPTLIQNSYFQEISCFLIPPLWFQLQQVMEARIPVPFQTTPFRCFISRLYWILLAHVSSQDVAFTSKLPWYPHASSCATELGTTGKEEEERVSCTHVQPDPSLQLLYWHDIHKGVQNLLWQQRLQYPDKGMKQVLSSAFLYQ